MPGFPRRVSCACHQRRFLRAVGRQEAEIGAGPPERIGLIHGHPPRRAIEAEPGSDHRRES